MKKIFLIRHAESEANVGGTFHEHKHTIKITEEGKRQAQELKEILEKPDRVIVSKFIRTIETAEPLINKFPETEVHMWLDAHEFEWISCAEEVCAERDKMRESTFNYFTNSDPFVRKENTEESFKEFADRIYKLTLKIGKISEGVNYIFTHGFVIKMILLILNKKIKIEGDDFDYKKFMQDFGQFNFEFKTKNTGVYDITSLVENI